MIGIRVDVNKEIATGHFMRCLSIAQGIRDKNREVIFISADEYARVLAEENKFHAIQLNTRWDNLESEVRELAETISKYQIKKLLIDSYYVTEEYLKQISKFVQLVYIDDINKFKYPVNNLVNYNIYFNIFKYPKTYESTNTRLFLGPLYTPLRREFRGINYNVNSTVANILITTGGSNSYNVAEHLVAAFAKDKDLAKCNLHVIAGKYSGLDENILKDLKSNICVYRNIQNISSLMKMCDIAVTAAGSTIYELCACGVPSISFAFADNQIFGAKAFGTLGLIPYSGDIRNGMEESITSILEKTRDYARSRSVRKEVSQAMQGLVDGFGTDRIVEEVFGF